MSGDHSAENPAGKVTDKANRCSESSAGREKVTSPNRQVQKGGPGIKSRHRALCALDETYVLDNRVKLTEVAPA